MPVLLNEMWFSVQLAIKLANKSLTDGQGLFNTASCHSFQIKNVHIDDKSPKLTLWFKFVCSRSSQSAVLCAPDTDTMQSRERPPWKLEQMNKQPSWPAELPERRFN